MSLNTDAVKRCLREFDFKSLFIEELGWDRHAQHHQIMVKDETFSLNTIAQKRGVHIFVCVPQPDGSIPEYIKRKKIEKQIRKIAHEHLIIFQNKGRTRQIWQWVKRLPGKAAAYREYSFEKGQSFERLIQKLDTISFAIDEEEGIKLTDVTLRLKDALDRDKVTKKFYDKFAKKNNKFLSFIKGISLDRDKEWYSSVMLNRLMFIYFIQKKGFLDKDRNYLRNHLELMKQEHGTDKFYSFYRYFLLKLFHEGLGKSSRTPELDELLGDIPYLNGGLFQEHLLEQKYDDIQIPDSAFEELFDFFDQYEWYLDDRPLRKGNEINPDVLGYIFEKFINQKEMGAYYTKEDITKYISSNTIIPHLFDSVKNDCHIAFDWRKNIWDILKDDSNRYIYDAVKKGVSKELPPHIVVGIDDVSQRDEWNKSADEEYALPTEIWRETIARRKHYQKVKTKIENGEIHSINDFITYNLDLVQFAQDVIDNAEGPELVRAFYKAISSITVLDPAVGSGAFLFAALNILEPLYEACLHRMEIFIEETEDKQSKFQDFQEILQKVNQHPNRQYFIYKSIILNNLYGVDIMDEAVEICKLRLFLKLVSVVENVDNIEALPDIDFNIRAGNTLVGFTSKEDVRDAITAKHSKQKKLDLEEDKEILKQIEQVADETDQVYERFRKIQNESNADEADIKRIKNALKSKFDNLETKLNGYLSSQYGIRNQKSDEYQDWIESHKPFHWFVDFYGIMKKGGFDAVIGNPPYVEYSKVKKNYKINKLTTIICGNLYAFFLEKSLDILKNNIGRCGMIIPLSGTSTDRMQNLQDLLKKKNSWVSYFPDRPCQLFDNVHFLLSIVIFQNIDKSVLYTTKPIRHFREERNALLKNIRYIESTEFIRDGSFPKINSKIERNIIKKINHPKNKLKEYLLKKSDNYIYYRNAGNSYYRMVFSFKPTFKQNGIEKESSTFLKLYINNNIPKEIISCLLSSSLFNVYWFIYSDCYHLIKKDIENFNFNYNIFNREQLEKLKLINEKLMKDYNHKSNLKRTFYKTSGEVIYQEFYPRKSKYLIDKIDQVLGEYYFLSNEELDHIINYDVKYRMGYK